MIGIILYRRNKHIKPNTVIVYGKIESVDLDVDGNINVLINKDRPASAEESVRRLREFLGTDTTIVVTPMTRRH